MYTFEDQIEFAYPPRLMFRAEAPFLIGREPTLRRMPDGTLISFLYGRGPGEPHPDNVAAMIRSEDDGESWSKPEIVFEHPVRQTWGTEIFTETERPFAVFHTYNYSNVFCELRCFVSHTPDSGRTWSEPVSFPGVPPNFSCRQGRVLSDGSWLFPIYWVEQRGGWDSYGYCVRHRSGDDRYTPPEDAFKVHRYRRKGADIQEWELRSRPDGFAAWRYVSGVVRSTDGGRSYTLHGCISPSAGYHAWEPDVIELEPGHLKMYIRCESPEAVLYESDSFDYGRTWTPPAATDIPNPGTKFTLFKIRGRVVLVNNVCTPEHRLRDRLELWVSDDGCRSWARRIPLASKLVHNPAYLKNVTYPHGFADEKSGQLYLSIDSGQAFFLLKIPFDQFLTPAKEHSR
ncbi:MAG: exo-alpha-sialidase [Lentisphaeria bacterium]|nr:exo-alpha-sialidase [Lentisphaeria bacterium]